MTKPKICYECGGIILPGLFYTYEGNNYCKECGGKK